MAASTTTTDAPSATGQHIVTFRISADTLPALPAEVVGTLIDAMFDVVALGISATTDVVGFARVDDETGREIPDAFARRLTPPVQGPGRHLISTVDMGGDREVVLDPPYTALGAVRLHCLTVRQVTYQNPLSAEISATLDPKDGNAVVNFIRLLIFAGPARRLATAEAKRAELQLIAEESTLETTIDERILLFEKAELDVKLKEAELEKLRIENRKAQLELAEQITQTQRRAQHEIDDRTRRRVRIEWTTEQAFAFADNVRLHGSIEALRLIGAEITVIDVE